MARSSRIAAAAGAVVALALLLAACGGSISIGASPEPTSTGPVTYTDKDYGYSISYDPLFTKGEPKDSASAGSSAVSSSIFVDEDGTLADGTYLDALKVTVYKLKRVVEASEVPMLEPSLQDTLDQLLGSMKNAKVLQPLTAVEIGGIPGFSVKYTFEDLGKTMTIASYFLFKGQYEYQIATQSASERWDELSDKFDQAVQSFTVK